MWLGPSFSGGNAYFKTPYNNDHYASGVYNSETGLVKFRNVGWFTNMDYSERHEEVTLYKKYNPKEYPDYDNYEAINVNKVADIPMDFDGAMGVPITFLDKYNPEQFEIISSNEFRVNDSIPFKEHGLIKDKDGAINGKPTYVRILIRNKKVKKDG